MTFGGLEASRYYQWSETRIQVRPPAGLAAGTYAVVVTGGRNQASGGVDYTVLAKLTAFCLAPGQTIAEPEGSFEMGVHRSGPTEAALTVTVTYSGTATHGSDYRAPETLTIEAGRAAGECEAAGDRRCGRGGGGADQVPGERGRLPAGQLPGHAGGQRHRGPGGTGDQRAEPGLGSGRDACRDQGNELRRERGDQHGGVRRDRGGAFKLERDADHGPVPERATSGNVVVTVEGAASNGVGFTVTVTAPEIRGLNPASGAVGTSVEIRGTNLGVIEGTSTVEFAGTEAEPSSWSETRITARVPEGATSGAVVVTVGGGGQQRSGVHGDGAGASDQRAESGLGSGRERLWRSGERTSV